MNEPATLQRIDFSEFGGPVYVGRDKGQKIREKLGLDALDTAPTPIEVRIPDKTYSVNSSFFLGMFGDSIIRLGNADAFFAHYRFEAPTVITTELQSIVSRALTEQGFLVIR